jgi:hypothetical protein
MLPDKLANQLLAAQPQYQPYLPFQQTPFHSTFPQPYQQSAPYLTTSYQGVSEKVESEESKVAALDAKHKLIWDSLVQMDPYASMVQYHKSFKKGYLDFLVFHQKHCPGYHKLQQYFEQLGYLNEVGLDYPPKNPVKIHC